MMNENAPRPLARDSLDDKVNRVFSGKVVRKDLVRRIKVGVNVPAYVLEYLLGRYCASSDELAIQMGLEVVNDILAKNYIRPDESTKAQSRVKEEGTFSFIDKVKVRLVDSDYWAEAVHFGDSHIHIPTQYVRDFDRLLMGGIWARSRHHDSSTVRNRAAGTRSGSINSRRSRSRHSTPRNTAGCVTKFSTEEWIGLLIRSMSYEPSFMERRLKLLFLTRLIPFAERDYNLVELGPRGTGKSYAVQKAFALWGDHDGSDDGREPLRPHERQAQGDGVDLGRGRIRRGRRAFRRCPRR